MHFHQLLLTTLTTLPLLTLAFPLNQERSSCAYTCGNICYTTSAVTAAEQAGYNLYSSGSEAGSSDYPHKYNDYEGFEFPVSGPYYEFPILSDGEVYEGGSPGADRVVFNGDGELAGVITHEGAGGNGFVSC